MSVSGLPDSVLLLSVIPFLDTESLLRLRHTSRRFRALVDDESVWRRKAIAEFNFPPASTARAHTSNSWRLLYIGLARSQVFLWGSNQNNRLALQNLYGGQELIAFDVHGGFGVPIPLRLDIKHTGGVDFLRSRADGEPLGDVSEYLGVPVALAAGGFSFAILTSAGRILGLGKLRDTDWPLARPTVLDTRLGSDQNASQEVDAIETGREFLVARIGGGDGAILQWTSWDEPVWVRDAAGFQSRQDLEKSLDKAFGDDAELHRRIIQVEAGWTFVVTLVSIQLKRPNAPSEEIDRQLWFWRPFWRHLDRNDATSQGCASATMGACQLPSLPNLDFNTVTSIGAGPELVTQVAAGAGFVVVLTSAGRLFQINVDSIGAEPGASAGEPVDREWSRMESFDDMGQAASALNAHPGIAERVGDVSHARITHISAHFHHFAAYSVPTARGVKQSLGLHQSLLPGQKSVSRDDQHSGFVMLGKATSNVVAQRATIVPELQGKGVIKIVFGDWHCGALTDAGHVFTWGGWQDGALGVYDSFPLHEDGDFDVDQQLHMLLQINGEDGNDGPIARLRRSGRIRPIAARPPSRHWTQRTPGVGADSMAKAQRDKLFRFLLLRMRHRDVQQQVANPTRVYFDDDLDRTTALPLPETKAGSFAFDIAMGGWHSGALVLDPPQPEASLAVSNSTTGTMPMHRLPSNTSASTHSPSSPSSPLISSHSLPSGSMPRFDGHVTPREPTADEMGRAGVQVLCFSLVAGTILIIGLLDGWKAMAEWAFAPSHHPATASPSWLNLAYFVPVAIPLALYLVIARWTGDQFFLHA